MLVAGAGGCGLRGVAAAGGGGGQLVFFYFFLTFAECLTLTLGKAAVTVALAVTATFLCRVSD